MRKSEREISFLVIWHVFVKVQVCLICVLLVDLGSLLKFLELSLEPSCLLLLGIDAVYVKVSLLNEMLELGVLLVRMCATFYLIAQVEAHSLRTL